ncbi:hypothetical protein [Lactobacillus xylocopicola]|uniref:ABC transporter permease n=1 Tax=Lactobacillus xylocopicola TaxID=2976676 RepID=A0ABN6SIH9_9LACO|nr:hypothetical protein [Lactobacillus xylocopicola]BDR60120.1 hypothetical protein KIM322_03810 [Lactobacillus xylocopicola]
MAYFKLQFKKVIKSSLTWLILSVVLLGAGLVLTYNAVSGDQSSIRTEVTRELDRKKQVQPKLSGDNKQVKKDRAILTALNQRNWQLVYRMMIKRNREQVARIKIGREKYRQATLQKNNRLQALLRANVPEEDEQRPKRGFLFLFKLLEGYLPALITVMLCFVLSNLFAAKYVDQLNRDNILPRKNILALDLILGLLVASGLTLVVRLLIFGVSSLLFGPGSLAYPISGVMLPKPQAQYLPLSHWLAQTLSLTALVGIFIVFLILFLAQVTRNQLSCLFLALVLLLGGAILPLILQSASKEVGHLQTSIVRYLPSTYLFSAQVVTGKWGTNLEDPQINFAVGCQVLVSAIAVLAILNLVWPKVESRIVKHIN